MAIKVSPVNVEERRNFDVRPGDTVRVYQKVIEKGKTRHQPFEGTVIARKHGAEPGATFTVRRTSSGVGVERIFPLYSPNIDKIEVLRRARVRRAKLYYIREKVAREIRRQMRRMQFMDVATESEAARAQREQAEAEAAQQAQQEAAEQEQHQEEQPTADESGDDANEQQDDAAANESADDESETTDAAEQSDGANEEDNKSEK